MPIVLYNSSSGITVKMPIWKLLDFFWQCLGWFIIIYMLSEGNCFISLIILDNEDYRLIIHCIFISCVLKPHLSDHCKKFKSSNNNGYPSDSLLVNVLKEPGYRRGCRGILCLPASTWCLSIISFSCVPINVSTFSTEKRPFRSSVQAAYYSPY